MNLTNTLKTAAIKNIIKSLIARILMRLNDGEPLVYDLRLKTSKPCKIKQKCSSLINSFAN